MTSSGSTDLSAVLVGLRSDVVVPDTSTASRHGVGLLSCDRLSRKPDLAAAHAGVTAALDPPQVREPGAVVPSPMPTT